jgi:hypothetical protein
MPTGYTACLTEGKPITFQEFAWRCARAFGPFVMQRDDSMDAAPILMDQPSTYHAERLEEAKKELATFTSKSIQAQYGWARRERTKSVVQYLRYQAERDEQAKAYNDMLRQVHAWNPPTPDHEGMKRFMVEQIMDSVKHDCGTYYAEQADKARKMSLKTMVAEHIDSLKHSVEYHTKQLIEEMDRVNGRNTWKVELVKSLGLPPKISA